VTACNSGDHHEREDRRAPGDRVRLRRPRQHAYPDRLVPDAGAGDRARLGAAVRRADRFVDARCDDDRPGRAAGRLAQRPLWRTAVDDPVLPADRRRQHPDRPCRRHQPTVDRAGGTRPRRVDLSPGGAGLGRAPFAAAARHGDGHLGHFRQPWRGRRLRHRRHTGRLLVMADRVHRAGRHRRRHRRGADADAGCGHLETGRRRNHGNRRTGQPRHHGAGVRRVDGGDVPGWGVLCRVYDDAAEVAERDHVRRRRTRRLQPGRHRHHGLPRRCAGADRRRLPDRPGAAEGALCRQFRDQAAAAAVAP